MGATTKSSLVFMNDCSALSVHFMDWLLFLPLKRSLIEYNSVNFFKLNRRYLEYIPTHLISVAVRDLGELIILVTFQIQPTTKSKI